MHTLRCKALRILFKKSISRWVTIGNADAQKVHAVLFIAVQKSFYMFKINLNMTVRGNSTNSQHLQFWFCILLNIFGKRNAFPLLQHENELTLAQQSRSLGVTSLMLGRRWCYHILISRDIHPLCRQTQVFPAGSVGQCQSHLWGGQHKFPKALGPLWVLFDEKTLPFFSRRVREHKSCFAGAASSHWGRLFSVFVPARAGHSSAGPGQTDVHPTHLPGTSWSLGRSLAIAGGAFLTPGICSDQQIQAPSVGCCLGCVSHKAGVA